MPTLSGSEWALLCVIVRQTLGWHDPSTGKRKSSDWLSHRQLKARTGRGADTVCSAIDSLVRRDLIEVKDEAGQLLVTPAERRRARRLFYALSPSLLTRLNTPEHPEPEHSEKPKRQKKPRQNIDKELSEKPNGNGQRGGKRRSRSCAPKRMAADASAFSRLHQLLIQQALPPRPSCPALNLCSSAISTRSGSGTTEAAKMIPMHVAQRIGHGFRPL